VSHRIHQHVIFPKSILARAWMLHWDNSYGKQRAWMLYWNNSYTGNNVSGCCIVTTTHIRKTTCLDVALEQLIRETTCLDVVLEQLIHGKQRDIDALGNTHGTRYYKWRISCPYAHRIPDRDNSTNTQGFRQYVKFVFLPQK
jgi:hypothetical protein